MITLRERLDAAEKAVVSGLLRELAPQGHWVGELSTSALSTATAVIALASVGAAADAPLVRRGLSWLAQHANADGGWGDTTRSQSNLSTTALAWGAFGAAGADGAFAGAVRQAEEYLAAKAGSLEALPGAIEARYGKDRTFSVPILMALALSGRLGSEGWKRVRPLPFELAALPRGLFGALRLPVVSYALPALIAIGQVIHFRSGRVHPLRALARRRTLAVLEEIQPRNGGFLEATPLTSFVTMSLAGMGMADHVVARRGAAFLRESARADGSWPIDTNLATWVTTLAINALASRPGALSAAQKAVLADFLIQQQFQTVHPYTGAAPGGWSWTNLPGAVPDADDTAGALLALRGLRAADGMLDNDWKNAVGAGTRWLLGVQNRDGGIPTFCRGWGALPFDRSAPELTAHALRAWRAWMGKLPPDLRRRAEGADRRAVQFLEQSQNADGSWTPLWFGNERARNEENPVYGTARVLEALSNVEPAGAAREQGRAFLFACQNADGGWGGGPGAPSTVEETSLALSALAPTPDARIERGYECLARMIEEGRLNNPAPIGLYFAKLWYFERLYPLIFAAGALSKRNVP